jgi:iron-sulfur cluster repair protein YtfE (RIC family)
MEPKAFHELRGNIEYYSNGNLSLEQPDENHIRLRINTLTSDILNQDSLDDDLRGLQKTLSSDNTKKIQSQVEQFSKKHFKVKPNITREKLNGFKEDLKIVFDNKFTINNELELILSDNVVEKLKKHPELLIEIQNKLSKVNLELHKHMRQEESALMGQLDEIYGEYF